MHNSAGQAAIRVRHALATGDAAGAHAMIPELDDDHRIEVLLGASLRDGRNDFAATRAWAGAMRNGEWLPMCQALATTGDSSADEAAAAWVAAGRLPEGFNPGGRALTGHELASLHTAGELDRQLVGLITAGVALHALLAAFASHRLHPSVSAYYAGGIRALGWRPLLLLAIVPR
ncbi:MAG: hypothetical protein EXR71_08770 [Myxococcales bacterium]|nr:hypothetical protein [Myxococcales bacterium]